VVIGEGYGPKASFSAIEGTEGRPRHTPTKNTATKNNPRVMNNALNVCKKL
jgi:hypothetical protein